MGAIQPRAAGDARALRVLHLGQPLARELGSAVGLKRIGGRILVVGAAGAGEHVVGAHRHKRRACLAARDGHVARALAVHHERPLLMLLGAVHIGPGSKVEHHVGRGLAHGTNRRPAVGDVDVGQVETRGVDCHIGQVGHEVGAEHAPVSDDQRLHGCSIR